MRQEAGRSAKTKAAPKAPFSKKALEQTPVPQSYDPPIEQDRPSTLAEYSGFQAAFEHFNKELFGDSLPDVLITLRARGHSHGYFSPDRFSSRAGRSGRSELALNPDVFVGQTDKQVCQTLAHELCHVWQHHFGTPAKNRYHNKEWGSKMKAVGLMPSNTGAVGGRETGQQMLDYILPGGPFELSFHRLEAQSTERSRRRS